jgi:FkbM family methyltransferase
MMKFYGQFDPPVDKVLYERYFTGYTRPGFFVECGAFDGVTECSCKFFEETLHWRGINIEPSPPIFRQLEINRPKSVNLNVALSDKRGTALFSHVIHPNLGASFGNGSLCHTQEHRRLLIEGGCTFQEYEVRTITWTELVKNFKIKTVDLLVLDVEGTELDVIRGMDRRAVLPKILCVEHGHANHPDELKLPLERLGYKYDFSSFVNSFFVRENPFEKFSGFLRACF